MTPRASDWRAARATLTISVITALVSIAILLANALGQAAIGGGFIPLRLAFPDDAVHSFFVPFAATPLTATAIHGGMAHLALNLLMFVFCGVATERAVGARGIVILYIAGAYAAALGHYAITAEPGLPMIGASGAISAIVGAYALLYGKRRARPIGAIPGEIVHVAWLAASWIGLQLLVGIAGLGGLGMIAIGAHIGGFIAGLLLARPLLLWCHRNA